MRLRPDAEALLTTERDRCLVDCDDWFTCVLLTGDNSLVFSEEEVPVSRLRDNKLCNNRLHLNIIIDKNNFTLFT